ncbi:DUF1653 domain-containing protein [Rubritalea sp.]|uniref:DUF1653 domain-containing protein n=1 Tax=Rubritalea sp. TaxID=2109375 RepID=UPI003EF0B86D
MQRELEKGKYRHFKGNEYEVVDTARCSETDEKFVIYRPLYDTDGELWIRPLAMFLETIEREGKVIERFEYMGGRPMSL